MNTKHELLKIFSPHLFWDIDVDDLDLVKHKKFIILRVLEFGNDSDWNQLRDIYSMDEIKNAVASARNIDPKVLHFIALITKTPLSFFRCYTNQQSNQNFYGY